MRQPNTEKRPIDLRCQAAIDDLRAWEAMTGRRSRLPHAWIVQLERAGAVVDLLDGSIEWPEETGT